MTEPEITDVVVIGIDIRTLPNCVSVWNGSQVEILNNTTNEKKIMKSYDNGVYKEWRCITNLSLSQDQHQRHGMFYEATANLMMRFIGKTYTDSLHAGRRVTVTTLTENNEWKTITAVRHLSTYLGQLKVLAETQLKRPVRNVVITVPVSFSRLQLNRIHRASEMTGLHVLKLMPQPTAVAMLYAQKSLRASSSHEDTEDSEREKIALIFNMDTDYSDVAVISTSKGKWEMKALAGSDIGGDKLLRNLIYHLVPDTENILFTEQSNWIRDVKRLHLLRVASLEAIDRLSYQISVEFDLDFEDDGLKICKVVTREEFEEINKEVFEECEGLIIQCLQDAEVKVKDINDVIIVGGCSHIPKVENLVTKILCNTNIFYGDIHPLEAALCGAAVEGAIASYIHDPQIPPRTLELITFSQFTPFAIGIRAEESYFTSIIPRHTLVPTMRDLDFTTVHDNQTDAWIFVYEDDEQEAEKFHFLGFIQIMGIPAALKGVPVVNVCMNIDSRNELKVIISVFMPGSHQPVIPVMEWKMPWPSIDEGHAWAPETHYSTYGDREDLIPLFND